jgi:hypothetical protein
MVQIYLGESLCYRIAGAIDRRLADVAHDQADYVERQMAAIEEYAVEASVAKVYCSEALDRVLDRALQWHGGYGFVEDYAVEKFVRDARVNRIFEGTNEINRLLVPGTLFKRAMQRRLDLKTAMAKVAAGVAEGAYEVGSGGALAVAQAALARTKGLALLVAGAASAKHGMALDGEQELMVGLSNLCIDACVVDSAVCRTLQRVAQTGEAHEKLTLAACTVAACEAHDRAANSARRLAAACLGADHPELAKIERLAAHIPADLLTLRKALAADAVERGGYRWSTY